jgi:preprotein translocase subunit SecG
MYGLLTGIILFVCILLILIVLVQNPKGGGLASSFSSSNQYMGVKRTADFI